MRDPDPAKPFSDDYLLRDGYHHVATYRYLRFEKLRYERADPHEPKGYKKTFTYRHSDGNGGWLLGIGDDRERPLYRLQNLLSADLGAPVYICESEKVCDKLAARGLIATCCATAWKNTDVDPLRGRPLRVLVDNDVDGAGERKAGAVLNVLKPLAASIGVVRGGPHGGNLADLLDDDITLEEFDDFCAKVPELDKQVHPPKDGNEVELQWECMADVEPEPVDWLWVGYIARGKLTLIAGDPGMGKSQIGLDATACITKSGELPDGSAAPSGSVLILTAEDSAKDTVRPRLEAAGADVKRVHRLKATVVKNGDKEGLTTFSLQHDLRALGEKLKEVGDVALVIIDPITSYMVSKIDSHRVTDVRAVLEPLAAWAEEHHVAVLGITHPPKNAPAKAIHAIVGSIAYVAAARLVFLVVEEPETERRLLLAVKNNLGPLAPGLGYALAQTVIRKGIVASHVIWDSGPVTITANEALAASAEDGRAMTEAKDFLREELADGPRLVNDLKKAAQGAGLSWSTICRAKKRLEIKPRKTGLEGGWEWLLPQETGRESQHNEPDHG